MNANRTEQYLSSLKRPIGKRGSSAIPSNTASKKEEAKKTKPVYQIHKPQEDYKHSTLSNPTSTRILEPTLRNLPLKIQELQDYIINGPLKHCSSYSISDANKKFGEAIKFAESAVVSSLTTDISSISKEEITLFRNKIIEFESQLNKRNEEYEYSSLVYQMKQVQFVIENISPKLEIILPREERNMTKMGKGMPMFEQNRIIDGVSQIKNKFSELESYFAQLNNNFDKYTKSMSSYVKTTKRLLDCTNDHIKSVKAKSSVSSTNDLNSSYLYKQRNASKSKGECDISVDKSRESDKPKFGFDSPKRMLDMDLREIGKEWRDMCRSLETYKKYVNQSNMKLANVYSNDMSTHTSKLDKLLEKINSSIACIDASPIAKQEVMIGGDYHKQKNMELIEENNKLKEQRNNYQKLYEKQTAELQALLKKQRESTEAIAHLKERQSVDKDKEDKRLSAKIDELIKINKSISKDKELMIKEVEVYKRKMEGLEKIITEDCNYNAVRNMIMPLFDKFGYNCESKLKSIEFKAKQSIIRINNANALLNEAKEKPKEYEMLKRELLEMTEQMDNYTSELGNKNKEIDYLQKELTKLEEITKEKTITIEDKQQLINIITNEKQAATQEMIKIQSKYENEIKTSITRINELQDAQDRLTTALEDRQKQCVEHIKSINEYADEKRKCDDAMTKYEMMLQEKEDAAASNEVIIQTLTDETNKLKLNLQESEATVQKLNDVTNTLKLNVQDNEAKLAKLLETEQNQPNDDEHNVEIISKLQEENEKLIQENETLLSRVKEHEITAEELNNKLIKAIEECNILKAQLEAHNINEGENDSAETKRMLEEIMASLDMPTNEESSVEDMQSSIGKQISSYKSLIADLQSKAEDAKNNQAYISSCNETIRSAITATGLQEIPANMDILELLKQRVETNMKQVETFKMFISKLEDELETLRSAPKDFSDQDKYVAQEEQYKQQIQQLSIKLFDVDQVIKDKAEEIGEHYKSKYDQINQQFSDIKMEIEDKDAKIAQLQEKIQVNSDKLTEEQKAQVEKMQQTISEQSTVNQGKETEIQKLTASNSQLTKEKEEIAKSLDSITKQLEQLTNEVNSKREEIQAKDQLSNTLQAQLEQCSKNNKEQYEAINNQYNSIAKEKVIADEQLKQLQIKYQQAISNASSTNTDCAKEMQNITNQLQNTQATLEVARKETITLKETILALNTEAGKANAEIAICKKDSENHKTQIETVTTELSKIKVECTNANAEISKLKNDLCKANSDLSTISSELTNSKSLLASKSNELSNLLSEHEKLSKDYISKKEELKANMDALTSKNNECSSTLNKNIMEINKMTEIIANKEALLEEQAKQLSTLNTMMTASKQKLVEYEDAQKSLKDKYNNLNSEYISEVEKLKKELILSTKKSPIKENPLQGEISKLQSQLSSIKAMRERRVYSNYISNVAITKSKDSDDSDKNMLIDLMDEPEDSPRIKESNVDKATLIKKTNDILQTQVNEITLKYDKLMETTSKSISDMQKSISEKESQLLAARKQISEQENKIKEYVAQVHIKEDSIKDLNAIITECNIKAEEMKTLIAEHENTIKQIKTQNEESGRMLAQHDIEISTLKESMKEKESNILKDNEQANKEMTQKYEQEKLTNAQLNKNIDESKQACEAKLSKAISNKDKAIKEITGKYEQRIIEEKLNLEKCNKQMENDKASYESQLKQMSGIVNANKQAMQNYEIQIKEIKANHDNKIKECMEKYNKENKQLKDEKIELVAELTKTTNEKQTANQELQKVGVLLKEMQAQYSNAIQESSHQTESISNINKQNSVQTEEINKLNQQLIEYQSNYNEVMGKLKAANEENKKAKSNETENAKIMTQLNAQSKLIEDKEKLLSETNSKIEELNSKINALQTNLNLMQNEANKSIIEAITKLSNEFDVKEVGLTIETLSSKLKNKFEEIRVNAQKYSDSANEKQQIIEQLQAKLASLPTPSNKDEKQPNTDEIKQLINEKTSLKIAASENEEKLQIVNTKNMKLVEELERNKVEVKKFIKGMPMKKLDSAFNKGLTQLYSGLNFDQSDVEEIQKNRSTRRATETFGKM